MSESIPAHRLLVFGRTPETGNPAVVLVDPGPLSDAQLQALATAAAVPDTAFVRRDATGRLAIRWFTPTREIALCGHATLAAARVLRTVQPDSVPPEGIEFDSARGTLTVTQDEGIDWLELPLPALSPFDEPRDGLVEALQIWGSETELKLPLELTPERDLVVPLSLAADLDAIEPEWEKLTGYCESFDLRAICLLGRQKHEPTSQLTCRVFAPRFGVPEDPATGSAAGPLALYALKHGWIKGDQKTPRITIEQGDALNIPCRLHVAIDLDNGQPTRLRVGGLTSPPVEIVLTPIPV